jgi:hypothetical protein
VISKDEEYLSFPSAAPINRLEDRKAQRDARMTDPGCRDAARSPLAAFFSPASVAVIGATDREGSVGGTVLKNLLTGTYKGRVYAVNPRRKEIRGLPCYTSIGAVPESVDLVVVVTPAETVPGVISECVLRAWAGRRTRLPDRHA